MPDLQFVLVQLFQDSAVQLGFLVGVLLLLSYKAKAQPTLLAFALILLPAPLLLLAFFWPAMAWLPDLYNPVLALLLLIDGLMLSVPSSQIELSRSLSRKFSLGQYNRVIMGLINHTGQPVAGEIIDQYPQEMHTSPNPSLRPQQQVLLKPHEHQTLEYELMPVQRGEYSFGHVHFRYRSHLKLLWMTARKGRSDSVSVYPDLRRIRKMEIRYAPGFNPGELHKRNLGMEGTEFRGLRHYFPGDDVRKIAWTASARMDIPVVRSFDMEVEQPIMVLLDAGRKMQTTLASEAVPAGLSRFDWSLNAALAFVSVALSRGDCVGAGVFSNEVLAHVPVGSGKPHLNRMLKSLSSVHPQPVEPVYENVMLSFAQQLKRRSLVVLFTEVIDSFASRALLRSLQALSQQHLLMVVTMRDPAPVALAQAYPQTVNDAYQKGVSRDLLLLREQALLDLKRHRQITVIDTLPEKLDESLIDHYLRLKQKSWF